MKKYFAAGAVAIMVFAFAAFAASLNVQASVLQAGETEAGALECASDANVFAWFYNDFDGSVDGVRVALDEGHTCDGEMIHVTPLDADGKSLDGNTRAQVITEDGTDIYVANFPAAHRPQAEDIEGVRVGIDQGHISAPN
jgi:hypothetical protein